MRLPDVMVYAGKANWYETNKNFCRNTTLYRQWTNGSGTHAGVTSSGRGVGGSDALCHRVLYPRRKIASGKLRQTPPGSDKPLNTQSQFSRHWPTISVHFDIHVLSPEIQTQTNWLMVFGGLFYNTLCVTIVSELRASVLTKAKLNY